MEDEIKTIEAETPTGDFDAGAPQYLNTVPDKSLEGEPTPDFGFPIIGDMIPPTFGFKEN